MNPNGGINVGTLDRAFRALAASLLLATPFLWTEAIGAGAVVGTLAGIIVMMTAIMGWDPMYRAGEDSHHNGKNRNRQATGIQHAGRHL